LFIRKNELKKENEKLKQDHEKMKLEYSKVKIELEVTLERHLLHCTKPFSQAEFHVTKLVSILALKLGNPI
jgi:hypothetical protein